MSKPKETPPAERASIITDLQDAQVLLQRAARRVEASGYHERAHRIVNYAQTVSCAIDLVEADWKQEDALSRAEMSRK